MASLMDLFRSGGTAQPQAQGATQQGQQGQQPQAQAPANAPATQFNQGPGATNTATKQTEGTAPNGTVPAEGTNAGMPTSPLDKFKDIWQNDPNSSASSQSLFNVDMAKLMESSRKMDFTKQLNPEIIKKIAAGGEESVAAFSQAMNELAQGLYAQSAFASTKISEEAVRLAEQKFQQQLPAFFKKQQSKESLSSQNAIYTHPSAQPLVEALQTQLAGKFPNASAKELADLTKEYLSGFAQSVTGQPTGDSSTGNPKGSGNRGSSVDWMDFMAD